MASIDEIVSVQITANTRTPTRAGFGTPLLMAYHTKFPELVRTYERLSDMVADGFTSADPAYLMAQALLSQSPRVESFKVGRLPAAHAQTQALTITSAVEGEHVRLTVLINGVATAIDYTILPAATTTTVATAVELLIEAIAGVNSSSAGAVITVVPATGGDIVYLHSLENCTQKDNTPDANYDDALTALQLVDDDWYFPLIDVNSEANVDLVAAWAETRIKIFVAQTADYAEKAGTGTLLSDLEALAYERTGTLFTENLSQYAACAWVGRVAPKDPGSITWKFKELTGVSPSSLTSTQRSTLRGNNGNTYETIAGLSITAEGVSSSGEFLDVRHGIDWLTAEIQVRVFALLANADKVPFTDAGIASVVNEIFGALGEGVARDFLVAGSLSVTAPKAADVSAIDKAARLLPDVEFGATLSGAVHKTEIVGTLSV